MGFKRARMAAVTQQEATVTVQARDDNGLDEWEQRREPDRAGVRTCSRRRTERICWLILQK